MKFMSTAKDGNLSTSDNKDNRQPYRIRLPGFIIDDEIGLGDVIKRITYAEHIKPCGGCQRRAATLNRWLVFSGRHSE